MKKISFLLLLFGITLNAIAQKKYTVDEIPDPKKQGQDVFVSNPDGILSDPDSINRLITNIEKKSKIEIAVVAVRDFDANLDEFEFGLQLFRKWGIGKKGADNGLLIFIATNRRKYRFVTGYGLEGLLPDVKLKHIAQNTILPAFKEQRYDDGVVYALNAISAFLSSPNHAAEIQSLKLEAARKNNDWKDPALYSVLILAFFIFSWVFIQKKLPPFNTKELKKKTGSSYDKTIAIGCGGIFFVLFVSILVIAFFFDFSFLKSMGLMVMPVLLYIFFSLILFMKYIGSLSILRKLHQDDENFFESAKKLNKSTWWLALGSPMIIPAILWNARSRGKLTDRFKPLLDSRNQPMIRVDRDVNVEGKPFLTKGQRMEETLFVYDYDIWENADHSEHQVKAWPAETYNRYTDCPECSFRTFDEPVVKTIKAATYTSEGQGKEIRVCGNCAYEELIKNVVLPTLVKETTSSGRSSSGGSSSSSSGSWGGGSSGGGGSGGSW